MLLFAEKEAGFSQMGGVVGVPHQQKMCSFPPTWKIALPPVGSLHQIFIPPF